MREVEERERLRELERKMENGSWRKESMYVRMMGERGWGDKERGRVRDK